MPDRNRPTRRPAAMDSAQRTGVAEGRRDQTLRLLRSSTRPRTILDLATQLQVHPNTVRFHLEALVRTGQAEQVLAATAGRGRPPMLFRATHRMDPDGPTNYRLLASMLTRHLATSEPDPTATATQLGRKWGPHLLGTATTSRGGAGKHHGRVGRGETIRRMVDALDGLGFAPDIPNGPRDSTVRLRHCPFLDLTDGMDQGGQVICALHLGLMQGALSSMGSPVTVDRLDPFAEPDMCVAHLTAAPGRSVAREAARA